MWSNAALQWSFQPARLPLPVPGGADRTLEAVDAEPPRQPAPACSAAAVVLRAASSQHVMATSLLLSVLLLLGLTTATSPQYSSVRDIVHGLSDACMKGVSRSATHQELRSGQKEIRSGQGHTQEQLTALQAQLTALQPSPEDCPAGWSRHGDNCYFIPPQKTSWLRAHHACAVLDRRARLASVHPASSQHIETLVATSSDWGVWVGLAWLDGDAGWGWSDGTPLDLTKWSPGEPSGGGSENCGHLWGPKDNRRGWNNYVCGNAISFLCQITLV